MSGLRENGGMSLVERIQQEMVAAMKQREVDRLSTLRMVKAAFQNKEIEQRAPLDDAQALQVLTTLIKQRKESIEQFTKGNRPDLADKEAAEIVVIEAYMPKAASEEEMQQLVHDVLGQMRSEGSELGPKEMGAVMKAIQARIQVSGIRADSRRLSEIVKGELAPK